MSKKTFVNAFLITFIVLANLLAIGYAVLLIVNSTKERLVIEQPFQIEYEVGDAFNYNSGKLSVRSKQGELTPIEVTMSMVSGFDSTKPGEKTLTIKKDKLSIQIKYYVVNATKVYTSNKVNGVTTYICFVKSGSTAGENIVAVGSFKTEPKKEFLDKLKDKTLAYNGNVVKENAEDENSNVINFYSYTKASDSSVLFEHNGYKCKACLNSVLSFDVEMTAPGKVERKMQFSIEYDI